MANRLAGTEDGGLCMLAASAGVEEGELPGTVGVVVWSLGVAKEELKEKNEG